jgi:hypothetical protein
VRGRQSTGGSDEDGWGPPHGIVGGVRPGAGDPHAVVVLHIARGKAYDQIAQLEEALVGEGMCRVEREMLCLLVHRLGDLGHAMAVRGDDG